MLPFSNCPWAIKKFKIRWFHQKYYTHDWEDNWKLQGNADPHETGETFENFLNKVYASHPKVYA